MVEAGGYHVARTRGAPMVSEPGQEDAISDLRCPTCERLFDSEDELRAHLEQERIDHPLAYPPKE